MKTNQFSGVMTALITPMQDGAVDYQGLNTLVEQQIAGGINGLVAVGTTGESPTLSHEEHSEVIRSVAETTAGRVPVLAGAGSNSTIEAVSLTKKADSTNGVDGTLHVAPYYNKPSQEGLFLHFSAIAEATEKPVILYSIPGRCGIEIDVDTCARLYEKYPNVCGIKEAGGTPERVSALRQALGDDYQIVSGDDSQTLPFISCGAIGVISVASNLVVGDLVAMVQAALTGERSGAEKLHRKYYPLFKTLFIEPNPVPVKVAMHRAGMIGSPEVRLPLCPMSADNKTELLNVLNQLGL
ncbi:4-hydroxy-tetrahydrodipicolinate synthase [Rubellicoccus peritrichatus]|uniref:4-hydroxy-tetrahydrodipicolinate synthase n=1 Tax=Rubellicoccus peritrichatus TaxID=3080537 RepID=A0AAQ3LGM5_9BACT|nr:4-hydroxy-tetrahydrodipicolinate synthase [Puniceicoccus sp. CR14]WOO43525.1 4-hydroxy-tetrahydrodipicolinate synthase [Puniceicoccus sp. CR14]